jgi:hypothetical protein
MGRQQLLWVAATVAVAVVPFGCAGRDLKPAATAQRVSEDAALATSANIRVIAEADAWKGPTRISAVITPMQVSVENFGNTPVLIRYENLKLVGGDGRTFFALPPLKITGAAPVANIPPTWVGGVPAFSYDRFGVAPFYTNVYPGIPPYAGQFPYDPYYYGTYYSSWPERELPTADMILYALPEGVLNPGGRVKGFVYFQKIPTSIDRVTFSARFDKAAEAPQASQQVAAVQIPFRFTK